MSRSAARRSGATRQEREPEQGTGAKAGAEATELTLVEAVPAAEAVPVVEAVPAAEAAPAAEALPTAEAVPAEDALPAAEGVLPIGEDAAPQDTATAEAAPAELDESPVPAEAEVEVASPVNYDDEGLGEVEIDGLVYRFDSGKQGTALCLSLRREGAWRWSYLGELRWDGRDLRSKALDRSLLTRLSASLRTLAEQSN